MKSAYNQYKLSSRPIIITVFYHFTKKTISFDKIFLQSEFTLLGGNGRGHDYVQITILKKIIL